MIWNLNNPWLWVLIVALVIIIAEVARNIINSIYKKELEKANIKDFSRQMAKKKLNAYEFVYEGVIFFEGKNRPEAQKRFQNFSNQQNLLRKSLEEKKNNTK